MGPEESGNPDTFHNSPKNLLELSAVSPLTAIPMRAVTSPDARSATHAAFRSAPANENSRSNGTDLKSVFLLCCVEKTGHHCTPLGTQGILVRRAGHLGHHPGTSPPAPCCNHRLAATRGAGSADSSFLSFFNEQFSANESFFYNDASESAPCPHMLPREKCRILTQSIITNTAQFGLCAMGFFHFQHNIFSLPDVPHSIKISPYR